MVAGRRWLLITSVAFVGALATLGLPSDASAYSNWTSVVLTAAGPSPSTLTTGATDTLVFDNTDSVTHTVSFANPACTFSVPPGYEVGPGGQVLNSGQKSLVPVCSTDFTFYAGTYAYTVDGTHSGTIVATALTRGVTLTARAHLVRRGEPLTLHGRVWFGGNLGPGCCTRAPFPVMVFARYDGGPPKLIAALPARRDFWHLLVRPGVPTVYFAEVSGQLPEGQIWTQQPARSHSFAVRIRTG